MTKTWNINCEYHGIRREIVKRIYANGAEHYYLSCGFCKYPDGPIPKEWAVQHADLKDVKTELDRANMHKCAVDGCTSEYAELHHWYPREIDFHEAERWPKAYLCREHHLLWHKKTKTGMYRARKA